MFGTPTLSRLASTLSLDRLLSLSRMEFQDGPVMGLTVQFSGPLSQVSCVMLGRQTGKSPQGEEPQADFYFSPLIRAAQ